ncbi:MAG: hypothetical protein FIA97_12315 [Methylococcaceae bacterium]|nr:hypothetical protein [Methylococcaceae bacterium]
MTDRDSSNVISFPATGHWSRIAKKYVHYLLDGDPRAACCYLEYELSVLGVIFPPKDLQRAIQREQ